MLKEKDILLHVAPQPFVEADRMVAVATCQLLDHFFNFKLAETDGTGFSFRQALCLGHLSFGLDHLKVEAT